MYSEDKRNERQNESYDKCQKDPNCNNLITPPSIIERDYGSVEAELRSYSGNGDNQHGNIACPTSCQVAATSAFQFSQMDLMMGHMRMSYLLGQTATAEGLIWGGIAMHAPVATGIYVGVSRVTRTELTVRGLVVSVGISKLLSPAVNYLGTGSKASKAVWEHNAAWLGNGIGFFP